MALSPGYRARSTLMKQQVKKNDSPSLVALYLASLAIPNSVERGLLFYRERGKTRERTRTIAGFDRQSLRSAVEKQTDHFPLTVGVGENQDIVTASLARLTPSSLRFESDFPLKKGVIQ